MEMQMNNWLPLTEYALRSGMSISTLRRKIKANSIQFKMEDGRYLIHCDELPEDAPIHQGFVSSDRTRTIPVALAQETAFLEENELEKISQELRQYKTEDSMRWRALEARVTGLAKKLDLFVEQMAEVKMLVKIFEEKLDRRG
jgi:hypothetical protein